MKRLFILSILCLAFVALAGSAFAQAKFVTPPDSVFYGVYENGIYFIAKKLVDAVEGSRPQLMADDLNWVKKDMLLSPDKKFYYLDSGIYPQKFKVDYCFSVGKGYIPHLLSKVQDADILKMFRMEDIVSNGDGGGYNFRTHPLVPVK